MVKKLIFICENFDHLVGQNYKINVDAQILYKRNNFVVMWRGVVNSNNFNNNNNKRDYNYTRLLIL